MRHKTIWVNLSIAGLCTVGLLGLLLRTKIVFPLPFINYNRLIEAHSHFTFSGWVTLSLMILMVNELLPAQLHGKRIYDWLLGATAGLAWCMMIAFFVKGYHPLSISISTAYILITYAFAILFTKDVMKAALTKSVRLLFVGSMASLVVSSFGLFVIDYIFFSNTFQTNAFLYRDSLFTYLHFQYNGFFSLAILGLLFNEIQKKAPEKSQKQVNLFVYILLISLIPSLFLSYMWQDPKPAYRAMAMLGSALTFISCLLFVRTYFSLHKTFLHEERLAIRILALLSILSFVLKLFLQCFTIFPVIGNAIFGNRPIIMSFLHLVFLSFVTLFILAYFTKRQILDPEKKITGIALIFFAAGVMLNEVFLITQGLVTMFTSATVLFLWLLWGAAIWMLTGAVLIAIARGQTRHPN
jgi:hypothetical protein